MRIAIIGAGIAGLACADRLGSGGHHVTLFDKGRGAGGRLSTRRIATPAGEAAFDHGAQYFTARDAAFVTQVQGWERDGHAARWPAAGEAAWVGVPGMNAVVKAMAAQHEVLWSARVESAARGDAGWQLAGDGLASKYFDALVVAVPAEQAAELLAPVHPAWHAQALATPSEPCWSVMAAFASRVAIAADVLRERGPLGWAARNGAKPGRQGPETWVLQGSPAWSREHLETNADAVTAALLDALAQAAGGGLPVPLALSAHRWRFARTSAEDGVPLWDASLRLGVCGDWLGAARVEDAWLSGHRLAAAILGPN